MPQALTYPDGWPRYGTTPVTCAVCHRPFRAQNYLAAPGSPVLGPKDDTCTPCDNALWLARPNWTCDAVMDGWMELVREGVRRFAAIDRDYRITRLGQKVELLYFAVSASPDQPRSVTEALHAVFEDLRTRSRTTCQRCGAAASYRFDTTGGATLCERHLATTA